MEITIDPSASPGLRTPKFYFDNSQDFWWLDRYTVPATDSNGDEIAQYIFNANRTQLTIRFGWQEYSARNFDFFDGKYFPILPNPSGAVAREFQLITGNFTGNDESKWTITENTISVEWKARLSDADTSAQRYDIIKIKSSVSLSPNDFFGEFDDMTWGRYFNGNNTIFASQSDDVVFGYDGDDILVGLGGNDEFDGGAGVDTVTYNVSSVSEGIRADMSTGEILSRSVTNTEVEIDKIRFIENIVGTMYDDIVFGEKSDNSFFGEAGNDTLDGREGDDVLDGGKGADTLIGGKGNDRFFVDSKGDVIQELVADNVIDIIDGEEIKQETFSMGNYNDAVVASVHYTLNSGAAVEDILAAGRGTGVRKNANLNLTGNELGQGLIGNEGENTLNGMAGDDTLVGFAGNDLLFGGNGDDMFLGGAGNDVMFGGSGKDFFAFGFGVSDGWDFNNLPFKAALTGGRDRADGGEGTDDALLVKTYDPNSIHIEREKSGSEYQFSVTGLNDESIQIRNIEKITFADLTDDLYFGRSFALVRDFSNGQDGGLIVNGNSGDDWIVGGNKNDVLTGNDGNDVLRGGRGDDELRGGAGSDFLTGGAGADEFIFSVPANQDKDTITDFARGDKIVLNAFSELNGKVLEGNLLIVNNDQMRSLSFFQDSNDYLVFDRDTSTLFYDADGHGAGSAVAFAELSDIRSLNYTDFLVI